MNEKLTYKYFEEITNKKDTYCGYFGHNLGNEDVSFIEMAQKSYNEYTDKLKKDEIGIRNNEKSEFEKKFYKERYDLMDCLKRGDYKKLFDSYINFCSKNEKRTKVKHLFTIYKEIKSYIISYISYEIYTSIIERIKNLIKDDIFPMTIDNLKAVIKDEFIYDILFDNEYGKDQIDELFFERILEDVGYMIEIGIEKEIQKIDILFLEYIDLIEKLEDKNIEGKKKALTDEQFKNYKNEYLTPQIIIDLINAGQLEQEMINGKYKPIAGIKLFMDWLKNNGYGDCLYFNFFKKFILYENTDGTIRQYLKPCNNGIKRKKVKT